MIVQKFLSWIETAPPGSRAEAAHALARAFLYSNVDADTRSGMEAAMTLLLDDPSVHVRFALADALATSAEAPRYLILSLAADHGDISELVLTRSPVFIDAELVEVVAGTAERFQLAVASRPFVPEAVSAAIAGKGGLAVCHRLLANSGAQIAVSGLRRMAERFGEDPGLRDTLLAREDLPADIRHLLIRKLGDRLSTLITDRDWLAPERAATLIRESCDRATVAIAAQSEPEWLQPLIEHLRVTGQLTTALLLRLLCSGNVRFFEVALSVLSGVSERRVGNLVRAGGAKALRALYAKACLPPRSFAAFTAALDACRELDPDGTPADRYRFACRAVDNVLSHYRDMTDGEATELVTMLRRFAADQAREAARDYARVASAA